MFRPIHRAVALATTALVAAVPLVAVSEQAAHAAVQPLNIVAIGDSYASGEGARGPQGWLGPQECHRSELSAPQQAANDLAALRPTNFTSFACTGSVIEDVNTGPEFTLLDPAGQLNMIGTPGQRTRVDALTISIGGNDIGFASLVEECMVTNCLVPAITNQAATALAALPAKLSDLINAIQGPHSFVQADVRNVFLTEYPDPTTGLYGIRCGNILAPGFGGFDSISEGAATWASQSVIAPLNADLQAAVNLANNGSVFPGPHPVWHFVTGISAAFATHGYCTGPLSPSPNPLTLFNPRYVNTPLDSWLNQGDSNGTMHPNTQGQSVSAGIIAQAMSFLAGPLTVGVTPLWTPVVGSLAGFTVAVTAEDGTPVPMASVLVDGTSAGLTRQDGNLGIGRIFSTAGSHTITVNVDPYPSGSAAIEVQGAGYNVQASPSPIPVGQLIPQLTLTARDTALGQLVNGTFTLTSANGNSVRVRSGTSAANVMLVAGSKYVSEPGAFGKPMTVRVPVCPTVTFQPDLAAYSSASFPNLISCKG